MLPQLLLASLLVVVTSIVHGVLTVIVVRLLRNLRAEQWLMRGFAGRSGFVTGIVLLLFVTAIIEAAVWAGAYLRVGAIEGSEAALYFSIVTFTTLGYGDVTLGAEWRLLASFQAAIGIIMFGWTTALLVAVIQRVVALTQPGAATDP
jgi:hypothetical protein